PKSVSLLYGVTRDERILDAFRDSVRATMEDIESEAKARVRAGNRNEDRVTGNLAWGEFTHFTARPVDGVPDPHLHAHCFAFNATYDQEESRWKAAQFGDIKRDAPYFEAVFHARLARRLEELGLATQRTARGWELAGLDAETMRKYSRRTERIERLAEAKGITDPELKSELGARTRASKSAELSMSDLQSVWRSRLTDAESERLDSLSSGIGRGSFDEDDSAARAAVARTMEHAFERASVLPERALLAEAIRQGVGKASPESIEKLVNEQDLIRAERNGQPLVTIATVLREESRMLSFAREGRGGFRPINPARTGFHREWLNDEQKNAVRHVLDSHDRVMIVRGVAGAGKTSAMQEVREAVEETGVSVHAFAPSSGASRGVLRDEGFDDADTVAAL
ncbi:MAG: MobF family relaxase, partial [Planctomycetota bacterium]